MAKNNRYYTGAVDKILQKQKEHKYKATNEQNKYMRTIPHTGIRTNKFIKIPQQYNINIGTKNNLPNNKPEIIYKNNVNGIYKLSWCKQCNMAYIGKSGGKFSTRLKEHETSRSLKDEKSLFEEHTNN